MDRGRLACWAGIVSAAPKGTKASSVQSTKEAKGGKFSGTLLSVTRSETTLVLNMTGGVSITIPIKTVNVVDARHVKPTAGTLQQVVEGAHVIVKLKD